MKINFLTLIFLTLTLVFSCGSKNDETGTGIVGEISELVGYNGPTFITEQNMKSFPFSGNCVDEEEVIISGSFEAKINCNDGSWSTNVDLSTYPNGVFSFSIKTESGEKNFNVTKNTFAANAEAVFEFEEADLGQDSRGSQNAVSVNNVLVSNDSEQGNTASFNGLDSSIVLSDGNFLNDEFTTRTVALSFKAADLVLSQIIYDEGGSTNAFGLKIEANTLTLATRVGGASGMESVSVDVTGRENQWVKVLASFSNGELKLSTSFEEQSKTTSYTIIPRHGDSGGIGMRIGTDAFDSASASPFAGELDDVMIFSTPFNQVERDLYFGRNVAPQVLNFTTFARVGFLSFEDASDLGTNSSHASGVVTSVSQSTDSKGQNTAVFNGNGSIELSDGVYFNESFDIRTYALYFKTSDVFLSQTIIDEGGSTNGISLNIENGYLMASARNGGASSQVDLIADISSRDNDWIKVVVSFDRGKFSMKLDTQETVIERTTGFSSIPNHSDNGGIGKLFNSDASGLSGNRFFSGEISKFSIYKRILSEKEMNDY